MFVRPAAAMVLSLACACSPSPAEPSAESPAEAGDAPLAVDTSPGSPVADLRLAVAALAERPEHKSLFVRVQHVLIGVEGAPRTQFERTPEEAEALAANIFRRAQDGEAFRTLMIESDDPGPGEYTLQATSRQQFAEAFGDVAWRLFPGEIGVCVHDAETSPFGYHVIQRIL